jgi:hypothetical protein
MHFKGCHVSEEGNLEFQALAHSQGGADETEVYHTNAEFLNDVCAAVAGRSLPLTTARSSTMR